jgi:predicted transcriptional regulator
MSDTPRTDEQIWSVTTHITVVYSDFARQLERELAEAKQEIERLDTRGIHSCHDNCQRPNCVLRRGLKAVTEQRDKAVAELESWMSKDGPDGWWVKHEEYIAERHKWQTAKEIVTEQRDRLVEACRGIEAAYLEGSDSEWGNALMAIREALAAVQGESP